MSKASREIVDYGQRAGLYRNRKTLSNMRTVYTGPPMTSAKEQNKGLAEEIEGGAR